MTPACDALIPTSPFIYVISASPSAALVCLATADSHNALVKHVTLQSLPEKKYSDESLPFDWPSVTLYGFVFIGFVNILPNVYS